MKYLILTFAFIASFAQQTVFAQKKEEIIATFEANKSKYTVTPDSCIVITRTFENLNATKDELYDRAIIFLVSEYKQKDYEVNERFIEQALNIFVEDNPEAGKIIANQEHSFLKLINWTGTKDWIYTMQTFSINVQDNMCTASIGIHDLYTEEVTIIDDDDETEEDESDIIYDDFYFPIIGGLRKGDPLFLDKTLSYGKYIHWKGLFLKTINNHIINVQKQFDVLNRYLNGDCGAIYNVDENW